MRRAEVVATARDWRGTPYRHQATVLGAGCDCLGLLRGVWRQLFGDEPLPIPAYRADWRDARHAADLLGAARRLLDPAAEELRAGQVLLFRLGRTAAPRHCGILLTPQRFIHAQEGLGVVEANLSHGWRQRLQARFDFPGLVD